jgi:hypothetical protein
MRSLWHWCRDRHGRTGRLSYHLCLFLFRMRQNDCTGGMGADLNSRAAAFGMQDSGPALATQEQGIEAALLGI